MNQEQAAEDKNKRSGGLPRPGVVELLRDPRLLLAFGFGSGLSPVMPGTMGTLVAVPLFLAFAPLAVGWQLLIICVGTLLGCYLCGYAAKKMQVHDHPGIVWDEFVGFWITMLWVPVNWKTLLAGFVLFRIFDMVKPWPINLADKHIHGGTGIMVDDIIAGVFALGCLQGVLYLGWLG